MRFIIIDCPILPTSPYQQVHLVKPLLVSLLVLRLLELWSVFRPLEMLW